MSDDNPIWNESDTNLQGKRPSENDAARSASHEGEGSGGENRESDQHEGLGLRGEGDYQRSGVDPQHDGNPIDPDRGDRHSDTQDRAKQQQGDSHRSTSHPDTKYKNTN